jgi:hypothetical protein
MFLGIDEVQSFSASLTDAHETVGQVQNIFA